MSLPKFSPKRLKEIAEGLRYRDGTLKVKQGWAGRMDALLKANKDITTANRLVSKPKIRKKIRPRRKLRPGEQSQVELFRTIWQERPHVSGISGLPLIPMPDDWEDEAHVKAWLAQFSHVLPKGAYTRFKARKDNILLKTGAEHSFWEKNKGRAAKVFLETPTHLRVGSLGGWVMCDDLYERLRSEANNTNT